VIDIDAAAPADLVEVGRVMEAYGVRGGIKIQPYSAQPDALLAAKTWWLAKSGGGAKPAGEVRRVEVLTAKRHGAAVAATWPGVDDRDQAQAWKGWTVLVPRSAFPKPADGEFYWIDLIGCELLGVDDQGGQVVLGSVTDVGDNGAQAILHVARVVPVAPDQPREPMLDAKGRAVEVLVPFVDAYIRGVDLEARRIDSEWPADF
jgi:16S rRNA processing protein RimM